mmetsp:Transcript_111437/g.354716  ORF Transcript_111437/g.354716 Transcript_111437/m.354716 type:complete len:113 (+) Transcript_111437:2405-2743(+)
MATTDMPIKLACTPPLQQTTLGFSDIEDVPLGFLRHWNGEMAKWVNEMWIVLRMVPLKLINFSLLTGRLNNHLPTKAANPRNTVRAGKLSSLAQKRNNGLSAVYAHPMRIIL